MNYIRPPKWREPLKTVTRLKKKISENNFLRIYVSRTQIFFQHRFVCVNFAKLTIIQMTIDWQVLSVTAVS